MITIPKNFSQWSRRLFIPYKSHDINFIKSYRNHNISLIKGATMVLLCIDVILIGIDVFICNVNWPNEIRYQKLFYAHIALLLFILTFCLLFYIRKQLINTKNYYYKYDTPLYFFFLTFMLCWCTYLSFIFEHDYNQITPYLISIFCLSAFFIIPPIQRLALYVISFMELIAGLIIVQTELSVLYGHIINSSIMISLCFILSKINYASSLKKFKSHEIISKQAKRLNIMNKNLEKIVEDRTKELQEYHKKLIHEINNRHKAEIETIHVKLLCEQKSTMLNEAIEREQLKDSFFANLSHELKTPLNLIFSSEQMLELLLQELNHIKEMNTLHKPVHIIKQNCYRLIRLISNLIDITKIDAQSLSLHLKNWDIVKIVEDISLSVVDYVNQKDIELIFDTEIEERIIACDAEKIERIILNLLSNAVKFTPKGGKIIVTIYDGVDHILISIQDTGIGIPPHMLDKIFDKFVQVNETLHKNKEGSGIGLSLVKAFVDMHKGKIKVRSDCGKGTEFILSLPVKKLDIEEKTVVEDNLLKTNNYVEKINMEFSDIYF